MEVGTHLRALSIDGEISGQCFAQHSQGCLGASKRVRVVTIGEDSRVGEGFGEEFFDPAFPALGVRPTLQCVSV